MEELFTITLLHKGIEKEFSGRLRISAYTHQFLFRIGESELIIEKDDEGNFRAMSAPGFSDAAQEIDPSLIQELISEMEKAMRE